jgi:hypothetical protein
MGMSMDKPRACLLTHARLQRENRDIFLRARCSCAPDFGLHQTRETAIKRGSRQKRYGLSFSLCSSNASTAILFLCPFSTSADVLSSLRDPIREAPYRCVSCLGFTPDLAHAHGRFISDTCKASECCKAGELNCRSFFLRKMIGT